MTGTNEGNTENGKDRDKLTDSTTDTPKSTENGNKTGTDIEEKSGNEIGVKDGTGTEKEPKTRSVSFNSDVHVKRFGKPRESRSASKEPTVRREFTYRSPQELKDEAEKVIAQTSGITCTADHPPEKFFSLPHRKKLKEERDRRNSDDATAEKGKTPLGRSTSDASQRRKERTSLSTLFRRAKEKNKVNTPITISPKPVVVVKRSKSDVSDLKSNTALDPKSKPIRKRSGSETEEFLRSLRNKKTQLSPIIESSPRDDYFRKTPPLEAFQKQILSQKESVKSEDYKLTNDIKVDVKTKVNPIQKPPRYSSSDKTEPKPPIRTKRGKSLEKDKEKSPPIAETPKRKTDVKKTLLVDEIDCKIKDINPVEVKERIKDSIRKIEENVYGDREMIHSSQKPPDKPPLTRGHTVDQIVRILKEDQQSPPPKSHLISPTNGTNANQPFSYIKPSVSPDPNLFVRNSPDRVPTPVNTMADKGVVYAHVVRDQGDNGSSHLGKQTIHKTYSPSREKYGNISDEDEGLGYEDRHKYSTNRYGYNYKNDTDNNYNSLEGPKITDSPIRPRFREYKLTSFDDFEPTYANEFPTTHDKSNDYIDTFRGRGDGMDTKKKFESENKIDLDFNELSHRRKLLESRLNARRYERERNPGEPVSRYLAETDPIYEAEKRMKATEKYVNETAKYIHHTLERDGFAESSITEDYNRYDEDSHKVKYNTETRTFSKVPKGELDRREFIDTLEPRYKGSKVFPSEPEYEPPSLELNTGKPIASPDEFTEKKYKVKKHFTSSQDVLQTNKYKGKDGWFGQRKGHYASNPEIAQEREDDYANVRYDAKHAETYHNSLRRMKNKDRYREEHGIRRHDSGDSRDYYRDDMSPRRFDIDSRLVDSGIENDFRKESSGEIHRKPRVYESDEDVRNTSLFLASERQHTEDNYPSEQIYANGEYTARFKEYDDGYRKEYSSRERSGDDGSILHTKDRYDRSPTDDKVSAKPPKATKKLSGLEKVKQLFSRDSSKKSKKEKEVQPKPRTRVLESPEHLRDDSEYRRFTDPEPSDLDSRKKEYDRDERRYRSSREMERQRSPRRERSSPRDEIRHKSPPDLKYRGSRESLDRHRSSKENLDRYQSSREDLRYRSSDPRDSDVERKYRDADLERRYERKHTEDRHATERVETRKYVVPLGLTDRCSEPRGSDAESERRKTRSRTAGPRIDSPALAERYRERRRLATPSPTPSPPPRPPASTAGNWFKSLDRLARKKTTKKDVKVEKESTLTTEDESARKNWSKSKTLHSPAKNLRFFGDTDQDSDANTKQPVSKSKSHPTHSTLRKTASNSSTGLDEVDHSLTNKSYSLTNLKESPKSKFYKRNLHNISERRREMSVSENESNLGRGKPPISPYDRSRSHSSSKTLKGADSRRKNERGSSSELRGSKQELSKHRRRTPANHSGESSTEGESSHQSHQSQRSVVYLHATTVGDIPDPARLNRSRDDVSSVNSSNLQVRSTTKSFSIFAPWTPKHYSDQHDVHYAQRPRRPKEKSSSTRNLAEDRPNLQKNKSYSQSTLTRKPQNQRLTSSSQTLYRKPEKRTSSVQSSTLTRKSMPRDKKSQSNEVLNRDSDRERISRSTSIPKDTNKKAGWFKLSNKKKQENTRVR